MKRHALEAAAGAELLDLLIVGWGNTLRGDDAAGVRLARRFERAEPGVAALAVHQLTPELAESVAGARRVVFADARVAGAGERLQVVRLTGRDHGRSPALGHWGSPAALLGMAEALYGRRPEAWLLALPGVRFGMEETLSATTRAALDEAEAWIRERMATPAPRGAAARLEEAVAG